MGRRGRVAILGAGIAGCCAALEFAGRGYRVELFDRNPVPISETSLHNEGKLHLGYVYAADPARQTYRRLLRGSLRFVRTIARLTQIDPARLRRSRPFLYGVPHDSLLSREAIEAHFAAVDSACAEENAGLGSHIPVRRLTGADSPPAVRRASLAALFATSEIAVDTRQIADILAACVAADPAIALRLGRRVVGAEAAGEAFAIVHTGEHERGRDRYDLVVNALWADRTRIDAMIGLPAEPPVLARYKATLTVDRVGQRTVDELPSMTLVSGPFGDLTNYGDGRFYLSWYPEAKLAQGRLDDIERLRAEARSALPPDLFARSIAGLGQFVDGLDALAADDEHRQVGGGFVVARGDTDIDDPESGLHRRDQIGARRRGCWITLDTGKYCTAPLFAEEAARLGAEALA